MANIDDVLTTFLVSSLPTNQKLKLVIDTHKTKQALYKDLLELIDSSKTLMDLSEAGANLKVVTLNELELRTKLKEYFNL